MTAPWNDATALACGIDALRRAIAPGCGFGRAAAARSRVFGPGDEAAALAASRRAATLAAALPLERIERLRAEIAAAPDPSSALARAGAGEVLADADLHDLARFGDALAELAVFDGVGGLEMPGGDSELEAALAAGRGSGGSFYLADAFAPELARTRGEAAAAQAAYDAARGTLAARAARRTGLAAIRDGEFVVMRDALPYPFPTELRVLREAPTYVLCELALDADAVAALSRRDAAVAAVASAEETVRGALSARAAVAARVLFVACDRLGDVDLLAARASFAGRHGGVVPDFRHGSIDLVHARFPPLAERLAAAGRRYVPVSLSLEGFAVVTGPNMGGKSAALRTLGFCAACAMLGVPVPARSASLPLFDAIAWLGIATDDASGEGEGLLSSFGREIVALDALLQRPLAHALVLIDEFAQTTSPDEGRALLVALLEMLRERRVLGLAATHFAGVAKASGVPHYATGRSRNDPDIATERSTLEIALARVAASMNFALERIDAAAESSSDAFALAAVLGLEPRILARARAALLDLG
jgi:DNA mismatch repair protein MutS2